MGSWEEQGLLGPLLRVLLGDDVELWELVGARRQFPAQGW